MPHVKVIAHTIDAPYIEGEKPYVKPLEMTVPNVFDELKPKYMAPLTAKVNKTVEDGEVLPYCGGLQVIFTPGHTPGHISLYHIPSKTLIPGDVVAFLDGEMQ